jgi:hypothetical protein
MRRLRVEAGLSIATSLTPPWFKLLMLFLRLLMLMHFGACFWCLARFEDFPWLQPYTTVRFPCVLLCR